MTGLNPSGLGRSERFNNSASESSTIEDLTATTSLRGKGLDVGGPASMTVLADYLGNSGHLALMAVETSVEGDNSAAIIFDHADRPADINTDTYDIAVLGRKQDSADAFVDRITIPVVDSHTVQYSDDTTISRSYNLGGGNDLTLAIDDAGTTYDVNLFVVGAGTQ